MSKHTWSKLKVEIAEFKMGGNQSRTATRKLTIENDDPTSVIRVSDEVVERIKGRQQG